MRRATLQGAGLLLTALTVWAVALVGWTLWRGGGVVAEGPRLAGAPEAPPARVASVLATNRLQLQSGEEVRLAAIEVPVPGEPFAEEGRQATRALVEGLQITFTGPLEAAFVYTAEGQLLQALLLSGGYARLLSGSVTGELEPLLREAQQQARDADIGIWRGGPLPTLEPTVPAIACEPSLVPGNTIGPQEASEHIGESVNVVFFAPRAVTDNGAVTLLVGLDKDAFGVTIPAGLASTVEDPALQYLSRCVVVSGRIERSVGGGPRIVIRTFEQLLVLR